MRLTVKRRGHAVLLSAALLCTLALSACGGVQDPGPDNSAAPGTPAPAAGPDETGITLSDTLVTVNGAEAPQTADGAVYLSHDIICCEDRDTSDSGNPYGEGTASWALWRSWAVPSP